MAVLHDRRPKGFSLIELLVVMAIVSLMIAVLLPALSEAKRRATQLRCMTQVRTLFTATLGYSNDNDSYLHYAGSHTVRNSMPASVRVTLKQYGANNDAFFCPSAADRFVKPSWNEARSDDYVDEGSEVISYLYFGGWTNWNHYRTPNRYSWPDSLMDNNRVRRYYNETAPTVRFAAHDKLSDRPIWIDNAISNRTMSGGTWAVPANNHIRQYLNTSDGQHVAYADGHAIWMSDPHNTRPKRYTFTGASATVTINW